MLQVCSSRVTTPQHRHHNIQSQPLVSDQINKGQAKLLTECTLPLTGKRVADLVITDLGVFSIARRGETDMRLIELADGVGVDEIIAKTEARFSVALTEQAA